MANLFWKTAQNTSSLLATPFKTEDEFERLIFETRAILEDVFLLRRQIRGGSKAGIPDIVGIDNDGNICIIEMKNVTVDASIIPQVLQYAFWAEANPDSIKSLWLEADNKPEDLVPSWDDAAVRVIVIAPTILRSTLDIVDKINYTVDLVEVKRWVDGPNTFLLVNRLEPDQAKRPARPVSGTETYNAEFYTRRYNPKSAREFLRYSEELDQLVRDSGWNLERKYNKHYCGFKAGFFNAFGIKFIGSKTFALFVKLPEKELQVMKPAVTRYEAQWKEGVYFIEPGRTRMSEFRAILEQAYHKVTGE